MKTKEEFVIMTDWEKTTPQPKEPPLGET